MKTLKVEAVYFTDDETLQPSRGLHPRRIGTGSLAQAEEGRQIALGVVLLAAPHDDLADTSMGAARSLTNCFKTGALSPSLLTPSPRCRSIVGPFNMTGDAQ